MCFATCPYASATALAHCGEAVEMDEEDREAPADAVRRLSASAPDPQLVSAKADSPTPVSSATPLPHVTRRPTPPGRVIPPRRAIPRRGGSPGPCAGRQIGWGATGMQPRLR